jgi:sRNA-binding protein
MAKYVEVFTASDITFAYLIKASLENAGISVQIANENLQGAYCLDGMVPCVLVPENHIEHAKQIMEEIQHSSQNERDDEQEE